MQKQPLPNAENSMQSYSAETEVIDKLVEKAATSYQFITDVTQQLERLEKLREEALSGNNLLILGEAIKRLSYFLKKEKEAIKVLEFRIAQLKLKDEISDQELSKWQPTVEH